MRAVEEHVACAARAAGLQRRHRLQRGVHRLLSHLAIGGPLAAGNRDEARLAHFDDVVARERLGVRFARVLHHWQEAAPRGEHVVGPN